MRYCLVLAIACACDGGSGGRAVSPEQLPTALAEVTCGKMAECCTPEEFGEETLGADNEAECRAIFISFIGILSDVLEDSIAAGRTIYHADRMGACIEALGSLSCTEYQVSNGGAFESGTCEDPFEGQVAMGGECANDWDCIDRYCSGDQLDLDGNVTFGVCLDPPLAGLPCDDGDCAGGAWCDFAQPTPTCADPKPDGAECSGDDDECLSGSCNEVLDAPSICGAPTTCDGM